MDAQSISIATVVRSELINLDGVTKFSPNRRFATVYSEGSPLDSLFFLESGLVKIHKRGDDNKEIILQIISAGELFGEQALGTEASRSIAAEVLQEGVIYIIPRDLFLRVCDQHPELWREISSLLTTRKRQLEKKIELLCLRDVEYRILYYMAELARMFGATREWSRIFDPALAGRTGQPDWRHTRNHLYHPERLGSQRGDPVGPPPVDCPFHRPGAGSGQPAHPGRQGILSSVSEPRDA